MSLPKLNEIQKLQAEKHQADIKEFQASAELLQMKLKMRAAHLQQHQQLLTNDFKVSCKTELDFDWNTLEFKSAAAPEKVSKFPQRKKK